VVRPICDYSVADFSVCDSATRNSFTGVQVLAPKPCIVFKVVLICEMLQIHET
jgi:hypothetical protein